MSHVKPLLLLDVDGVLNPYPLITKGGHLPPKVRDGERRYSYDRHVLSPLGFTGLPVLISPDHGEALRSLSDVFDLVWATTWEHDANRLLAPLLGIPQLPVINWGSITKEFTATPERTCWKTRHIARWLEENGTYSDGEGVVHHRPWVWVDDDLSRHDRRWLSGHYGEAKDEEPLTDRWLFRVEPVHGLRENDFEALRTWGLDHTPRIA